MNITNAQYQSLKADDVVVEAQHNIVATINGVKTFVPIDPASRSYAEILRQVAAGELTIADAD
jgi:hypothetical protein